MLRSVGPRLEEIEGQFAAVRELGEKPAGLIRITPLDYVVNTILLPRLSPVLERHPDVRVEI